MTHTSSIPVCCPSPTPSQSAPHARSKLTCCTICPQHNDLASFWRHPQPPVFREVGYFLSPPPARNWFHKTYDRWARTEHRRLMYSVCIIALTCACRERIGAPHLHTGRLPRLGRGTLPLKTSSTHTPMRVQVEGPHLPVLLLFAKRRFAD